MPEGVEVFVKLGDDRETMSHPSHHGKKPLPSINQTFKAGTKLVLENDSTSRKMFIIRSGKARVYKTYMSQKITLAVLGEGEVFGEMSFFDAEPRSASVEALTDLSAIVLDGEVAKRELEGLPDWITPIFRTVFHRFREMDRKMTVLQSMNEFQKRAFRTDNVAKTIYLEILRFIKTLRILYGRDFDARGVVSSDTLYTELDEVLGNRSIGLRVFWRMLKEYDFIDHEKDDTQSLVVLNDEALKGWSDYLVSEVENESFLMLSHSSVAVLGKIVGFTRTHEMAGDAGSMVAVGFAEMGLEKVPLHEEAVEELTSRKVLRVSPDSFVVEPGLIYRLYTYQSILKAFDHTIVNMD